VRRLCCKLTGIIQHINPHPDLIIIISPNIDINFI
jgi:hypothetical protein